MFRSMKYNLPKFKFWLSIFANSFSPCVLTMYLLLVSVLLYWLIFHLNFFSTRTWELMPHVTKQGQRMIMRAMSPIYQGIPEQESMYPLSQQTEIRSSEHYASCFMNKMLFDYFWVMFWVSDQTIALLIHEGLGGHHHELICS